MSFTKKEIDTVLSITKHINPKLNENIQIPTLDVISYSFLYKKESYSKITVLWFYLEKINEHKLKILFKRHVEVEAEFFIRYNPKLKHYVIGWKI